MSSAVSVSPSRRESLAAALAAVALTVAIGFVTWWSETVDAEARLQAIIARQRVILSDLLKSGGDIAKILATQPDVVGILQTQAIPDAGNPELEALLAAWPQSVVPDGLVVATADGRVLWKTGVLPPELDLPAIVRIRSVLQDRVLVGIPQSGATMLAEKVPGGTGYMLLHFPETRLAPVFANDGVPWRSAEFALAVPSQSGGVQLLRPYGARPPGREVDERWKSAMDQVPTDSAMENGLMRMGDDMYAWSGSKLTSPRLFVRVNADEYHAQAFTRSLTVALSAGGILALPVLLVSMQNRSARRRYDARLSALRGRIDEQTREQARLLVKNAQLSAAARMAGIGHWVTKLTERGWVMTAATPEIAEIYGVPQRRLVGSLEYSRGHVHPEDQERVYGIWNDVNQRPRRYEVEFRILKPGGGVCHVLEVGEPVRDQNGALTHFHGTMQDITAYRRSRSGVENAEVQLRQPPGSTRTCHWVAYEVPGDVSGATYSYSRQAADFYGVPVDQLPTRSGELARFIHPDDMCRLMEQYAMSLKSPAAYRIRYRLVRPDGTVRWIEEAGEPVFGPDGKISHTFGTMTEVAPPASIAMEESAGRPGGLTG